MNEARSSWPGQYRRRSAAEVGMDLPPRWSVPVTTRLLHYRCAARDELVAAHPPLGVMLYVRAGTWAEVRRGLVSAWAHAEARGWRVVGERCDVADGLDGWLAVRRSLVGGFACGVVSQGYMTVAAGVREYEARLRWCVARRCFVDLVEPETRSEAAGYGS